MRILLPLCIVAVLLAATSGCGTSSATCSEGNLNAAGTKVCRHGTYVAQTVAAVDTVPNTSPPPPATATATPNPINPDAYMNSLPAAAQVAVRQGIAGLKRGLASAGEAMDGAPDDMTCSQWLGADPELLKAFASGILEAIPKDQASPDAPTGAIDLINRVSDACVTARSESITGLLARQMALVLGVG